jgi:hypothetical protein
MPDSEQPIEVTYVPFAPVWRGDFSGPDIYPQRWANGTMHFTKVHRGGAWQLDKTWVPDTPGEEPRSPWDADAT